MQNVDLKKYVIINFSMVPPWIWWSLRLSPNHHASPPTTKAISLHIATSTKEILLPFTLLKPTRPQFSSKRWFNTYPYSFNHVVYLQFADWHVSILVHITSGVKGGIRCTPWETSESKHPTLLDCPNYWFFLSSSSSWRNMLSDKGRGNKINYMYLPRCVESTI